MSAELKMDTVFKSKLQPEHLRVKSTPVIKSCDGSIVNTQTDIEPYVFKKFVGIPALASLEGSYVQLNEDWIITVKHNKPLFINHDFIEHPECDVALVKMPGSKGVKTGDIFNSQNTYMAGYPIGRGFTNTAGYYLGDVRIPNDSCLYSASSNHIGMGMSGGAVTNDNNELVGIIVGYQSAQIKWPNGVSHNKPSVFVSINYIKDWINSVTK